jgi:hypothetical protein
LARIASLSDASVSFVGVGSYADLEAAGNLIDCLDAYGGSRGAILVNVAPRHKGEGENGTPFGYFWHNETLVVSTLRGLTLSLVKKLGIAAGFTELDVATASHVMAEAGLIEREEAERIAQSQFRSFDFVPRAAAFLLAGNKLPGTTHSMESIADSPGAIWWVDNFGNCKTTLLPEDVEFEVGKEIATVAGSLLCTRQLKSVPNGRAALIIGSSGIGTRRFLEIVVQGESAAGKYGLAPGTPVLDKVLASA